MSFDDFALRRRAIAEVLGKLIGPIGFQKTLADRAGVDPTAVSEYLAAKRTAGEPQLRKLADGLDIGWSHFWEMVGDAQVHIAREEEEQRTGTVRERPAEAESSHETVQPVASIDEAFRTMMLDTLREVLPPLLHQELVDHGLIRAPDSRKTSS